jgi:hypothetical protein
MFDTFQCWLQPVKEKKSQKDEEEMSDVDEINLREIKTISREIIIFSRVISSRWSNELEVEF